MLTWADRIEARFHAAQAQMSKLAPALHARAFRSRLVPQDPTDEPAEKLLERSRQKGPRIAQITRMKKGQENP
jgi:type I restriction enzyme S subunit